MPPERPEERYQPLALVSVMVIALLGFAAFFLSFLVAPLAILAIFYVGFAASDRAKRSQNGTGPAPAAQRLAEESRARQDAMQRGDAAAPGGTAGPTAR